MKITKELVDKSISKFLQVLAGTGMAAGAKNLFADVLKGMRTVSRKDTYFDKDAAELMKFVENRLAAPHLQFLAESQNNGIWGDSTTKAIQDVIATYGLTSDGQKIDQQVALAIVDGTLTNKRLKPTQPNSYQFFKALALKKGAEWIDTPGLINIVSIRGYTLDKGKVPNIENIYNDITAVCYIDVKTGKEVVDTFLSSCDPGYYYYKLRPLNEKGAAHLKTGFWKYQRGGHGVRQYGALVQAQPVTVARSFTGVIRPGDHEDTGWFGINIHAGTLGKWVYNASAGCQVIWSDGFTGHQYVRFMSHVKAAYARGQRIYGYTLLDSAEDL